MFHLFFFSTFFSISTALTRFDITASSFTNLYDDYVLFDYVISSHLTQGIQACAHLCLLESNCLSFNFIKTLELFEKGLCELNRVSCRNNRNASLTNALGYVYGEFIDVKTNRFIFTTLGARGKDGPTKAQLEGYKKTSLEGQVDVQQGIQFWKVPESGTYVIEAFGASGGNGTCQTCSGWKLGGLGARIKGTFYFNKGTALKILVGQQGLLTEYFNQRPGGGGGGTFVTLVDNTIIVVAGGGGGGSLAKPSYGDGDPGQKSENGTQYGGYGGMGGFRYQTVNKTFDSPDIKASSGAGYRGDGDAPKNIGITPARSFLAGGTGGGHVAVQNGGFGGGGCAVTHGGGGGGYSGGGITGTTTSGTAGGGGSFNSGLHQVNDAGVNKGHGKVIVTLLQ